MKNTNVVACGVGGQGVLLATSILANTAMKEGLDVLASEVHGMAQRGGSIVSHLRIGRELYSPLVTEGSADLILGFEPAEVLRVLRFAKNRTWIVVNTRPIMPTTVSIGVSKYPAFEVMVKEYLRFSKFVVEVDAMKLALKAGSSLAQNIVMLGASAATGIYPMKNEALQSCIQELSPGKYLGVNLKAFEVGFHSVSSRKSMLTHG